MEENENLGELDLDLFNGVPENKNPVPDIGIGETELKELLNYFEGKGDRPKFLDSFMSSAPDKVAEFAYTAIALQLARVPSLISMLGSVNSALYSPSNVATMDVKDLSIASKNISSEIANIQESSRRQLETLQRMSSLSGQYKEMLDQLISYSPEQLQKLKSFMKDEDENA